MVQVDIFWSYGLSAGLALASQQTLKKADSFWQNPAFTLTLLWISCVFAPSGLYLLWAFPGWETMFVAKDHLSIPAWLTALFALTNITQGVLGFYITAKFIRVGNMFAAKMQTIWAHTAMAIVLIFGWDGTGYKRFFYAGSGTDWHNQVDLPLIAFFSSPIFYTLLGMGVVFVPSYIWLVTYLRKTEF